MACKHESKPVFDLGFQCMKILCENNPDLLLQEFETKGNGI